MREIDKGVIYDTIEEAQQHGINPKSRFDPSFESGDWVITDDKFIPTRRRFLLEGFDIEAESPFTPTAGRVAQAIEVHRKLSTVFWNNNKKLTCTRGEIKMVTGWCSFASITTELRWNSSGSAGLIPIDRLTPGHKKMMQLANRGLPLSQALYHAFRYSSASGLPKTIRQMEALAFLQYPWWQLFKKAHRSIASKFMAVGLELIEVGVTKQTLAGKLKEIIDDPTGLAKDKLKAIELCIEQIDRSERGNSNPFPFEGLKILEQMAATSFTLPITNSPIQPHQLQESLDAEIESILEQGGHADFSQER